MKKLGLLGLYLLSFGALASNPFTDVKHIEKNDINIVSGGGGFSGSGGGSYKSRGAQMVSPYANKKRKKKNRDQRKARKQNYRSKK